MMSQSADNNPFVLPGMGQASGDMAGNPLFAGLEMMRRAWTGLAGANGLAQSLPLSPMLNIDELDKRLAELKSVESWLSLNLSMLSSTIQGLEVQRATLTTLRSFVDAASHAPQGQSDGRSPLEVVLGIRPGGGAPAKAPSNAPSNVWPSGQPEAEAAPPADGAVAFDQDTASAPQARALPGGWPGADLGQAAGGQVMQASQAWWDMMQQQFQQLAAATTASVAQPSGAADLSAAPRANGPRSSEKPLMPRPARQAAGAARPAASVAKKASASGKTASASRTASATRKAGAAKKTRTAKAADRSR